MEYVVVSHFNKHDIAKEVNERLEEGFELLGNLCLGQDSDSDLVFAQAMIKYDEAD